MNALTPRAPFQVLIMSEESRLGREQIETAYALKQLVTAGIHVWLYLEDRECTLDSPTAKYLASVGIASVHDGTFPLASNCSWSSHLMPAPKLAASDRAATGPLPFQLPRREWARAWH
jgi:hypothetical protein